MLRGADRIAIVVVVSLTVGAIAAATASFVGWRLSTPSPTVGEATTVVRIGLPDASIASIGWHDDVRDIHSAEGSGSGRRCPTTTDGLNRRVTA